MHESPVRGERILCPAIERIGHDTIEHRLRCSRDCLTHGIERDSEQCTGPRVQQEVRCHEDGETPTANEVALFAGTQ